jgi:hypothetical protein
MDTKEILQRIGSVVPVLSKLEKSDLPAWWMIWLQFLKRNSKFSPTVRFGPEQWSKSDFGNKQLVLAITLPITLKQFQTADYHEKWSPNAVPPHWACLTITSGGCATFRIQHLRRGIALSPELEWTGRSEEIVNRVIDFYKNLNGFVSQLEKVTGSAPGFNGVSNDTLEMIGVVSLDDVLLVNFCRYSSIPYITERYSQLYIVGKESFELVYDRKFYDKMKGDSAVIHERSEIQSIVSAEIDQGKLIVQYKDGGSKDATTEIWIKSEALKLVASV